MSSSQAQRLDEANALIKLIGSHGRRFFFSSGRKPGDLPAGISRKTAAFMANDRFAEFSQDESGRLWLTDDYKGACFHVRADGRARELPGFSHGGTLRALIEDMAQYIAHGKRIDLWKIATPRISGDSNIWGYDAKSATDLREMAAKLAIMHDTQVIEQRPERQSEQQPALTLEHAEPAPMHERSLSNRSGR